MRIKRIIALRNLRKINPYARFSCRGFSVSNVPKEVFDLFDVCDIRIVLPMLVSYYINGKKLLYESFLNHAFPISGYVYKVRGSYIK